MVRIAPVRLTFNPKTLWFDARDLELPEGTDVVVNTVRGQEFGTVAKPVFEMDYEETKKLKSPLKPVERIADENDASRAEELAQMSKDAMPVFRSLALQCAPDMNPVAVEYLFSGDKAVFYFESEERVDFRELVRKLSAEFRVKVDMKQIGVRDSARMVGGIGHCGQELCCRRLGGEFNPVSIRMAKEQDLSLNPQKISGVCGRLMCCLRYEFDAYKDFHSRAPKKNAKIITPDGEGKVVDLDVPREIVSIKVGEEKPVKVPLADMEPACGGARPNEVGDEAWERANAPASLIVDELRLFTTQELTGTDKLAEPGQVRHVHSEEEEKPKRSRRSRRRSASRAKTAEANAAGEVKPASHQQRRRRSTTVKSDGSTQTSGKDAVQDAKPRSEAAEASKPKSRRGRSRNRANRNPDGAMQQRHSDVQVGRNSSALRAARQQGGGATGTLAGEKPAGQRRRRRSHKTNTPADQQNENR